MKELLNKAIAKIVHATAICGAGEASMWNIYQPKEPAALKKSKDND